MSAVEVSIKRGSTVVSFPDSPLPVHIIGDCLGLLGITGEYWRLRGLLETTGDYWGLLETTGDYWELLDNTGDYWRLLDSTRDY